MDFPNDFRVQYRPLTDGYSDWAADRPQSSWSVLFTLSIPELADECRQSLQDCIQVETLMEHEWAADRLAEFTSWAADLGAFASGKDSLDGRLSADPVVRGLYRNIFILLKTSVEECKAIASGLQDTTTDDLYEQNTQDEQSARYQSPPRAFSPWSTSSSTDSESETESISPWSTSSSTDSESETEPDTESDLPLENTSPLQSSKEEVEQWLSHLSDWLQCVQNPTVPLETKSRLDVQERGP